MLKKSSKNTEKCMIKSKKGPNLICSFLLNLCQSNPRNSRLTAPFLSQKTFKRMVYRSAILYFISCEPSGPSYSTEQTLLRNMRGAANAEYIKGNHRMN